MFFIQESHPSVSKNGSFDILLWSCMMHCLRMFLEVKRARRFLLSIDGRLHWKNAFDTFLKLACDDLTAVNTIPSESWVRASVDEDGLEETPSKALSGESSDDSEGGARSKDDKKSKAQSIGSPRTNFSIESLSCGCFFVGQFDIQLLSMYAKIF